MNQQYVNFWHLKRGVFQTLQCRPNVAVSSRYRGGFTIVELLVASFIVTTALLGIYTTFKQALDVEKHTRNLWHDRTVSESITGELAETLENCINLSDVPTLVGKPGMLKCTMIDRGYGDRSLNHVGIGRHYYTWQAGNIHRQILKYSGTQMVTPIEGQEELNEDQLWFHAPSQTIGKDLNEITVLYRKTDNPTAPWKNSWQGPAGNVAIWIRVSCRDQSTERIVTPWANVPFNQ